MSARRPIRRQRDRRVLISAQSLAAYSSPFYLSVRAGGMFVDATFLERPRGGGVPVLFGMVVWAIEPFHAFSAAMEQTPNPLVWSWEGGAEILGCSLSCQLVGPAVNDSGGGFLSAPLVVSPP